MDVKEALTELKKGKERKFNQSIDLIVNLKGIDLRKTNVSTVVNIPNKVKDKKVCAFLLKKNELVYTVTEPEFQKYKDQKMLKNLVDEYDFFIASAPLMPKVATVFGKVLGPAGKMPSPQLGILSTEDKNAVQDTLDKISKSFKIRVKDPSIKLSIGKQEMDEEKIIENINSVYKGIIGTLPNKKENVKNVMIKLTMGKPVKVEIK